MELTCSLWVRLELRCRLLPAERYRLRAQAEGPFELAHWDDRYGAISITSPLVQVIRWPNSPTIPIA